MRLGVLDVGSNTVHLLVVDARPGARPLPAYSHKAELRLAEHLDDQGAISDAGRAALERFVAEALEIGEDKGCQSVLAFATSAIREATNGDDVLRAVAESTSVELSVLPGAEEARLTFLAVRRWFGWSSRRLLVFDVGGGSLEIGIGVDEDPDAALSMPLGAGRLTRDWFTSDPPDRDEVRALRKYVRAEIARHAGLVVRFGAPDHVVGTSKTFRQLVRVCGAAPSSEGPYVKRVMARSVLEQWIPKLAAMSAGERVELPGVSPGRAHQLLAGAIVADAAMDLFGAEELEACPWALREGVILRHLDTMEPEDFA
ncbi:Ppx/GppA phosphatase family protein [Actinopolymorpha alba]|uniref:Ppx/GppA phosphatase family protein n=1 Tax=Actinopolymorpha alba TaxID=533267 RepID=UPI00035DC4EC|nr:Ppx/GppA phosphatase family protein [Actinopolymorpha alba]